jgi:hypothetical protein
MSRLPKHRRQMQPTILTVEVVQGMAAQVMEVVQHIDVKLCLMLQDRRQVAMSHLLIFYRHHHRRQCQYCQHHHHNHTVYRLVCVVYILRDAFCSSSRPLVSTAATTSLPSLSAQYIVTSHQPVMAIIFFLQLVRTLAPSDGSLHPSQGRQHSAVFVDWFSAHSMLFIFSMCGHSSEHFIARHVAISLKATPWHLVLPNNLWSTIPQQGRHVRARKLVRWSTRERVALAAFLLQYLCMTAVWISLKRLDRILKLAAG